MSDLLESPSGAPILLDLQGTMTGASIAAASTGVFTMNVLGAKTGAIVSGSPTTAIQAGLVIGGFRVVALGVISVQIGNVTAGPIVPSNYVFDLAVFNP
jgi:hypothetical protein